MIFTCRSCGKQHDTKDISFGADAPSHWDSLPEEIKKNSERNADQCVITTPDEVSYYVRGCLEIPVIGVDRSFTWGVWVSLSEKSMVEMTMHWDDANRVKLGPYFGWLFTNFPYYPKTLLLKTNVHNRAVGLRPLIELQETDHPLSVHQRTGISESELQKIIMQVMHPTNVDQTD